MKLDKMFKQDVVKDIEEPYEKFIRAVGHHNTGSLEFSSVLPNTSGYPFKTKEDLHERKSSQKFFVKKSKTSFNINTVTV